MIWRGDSLSMIICSNLPGILYSLLRVAIKLIMGRGRIGLNITSHGCSISLYGHTFFTDFRHKPDHCHGSHHKDGKTMWPKHIWDVFPSD